jgi:hypothetical protein
MFITSVGFEPTSPAFERIKTVHASERLATVVYNQPEPIFQFHNLASGICCYINNPHVNNQVALNCVTVGVQLSVFVWWIFYLTLYHETSMAGGNILNRKRIN